MVVIHVGVPVLEQPTREFENECSLRVRYDWSNAAKRTKETSHPQVEEKLLTVASCDSACEEPLV